MTATESHTAALADWLRRQDNRDSLRLLVYGEAGLGKRTLIGQLPWSAEPAGDSTADDAPRHFTTARRHYRVTMLSGRHLQETATAATNAEAALILLDARHGFTAPARRLIRLLALTGLRQIALVVDKMDLIGFDEAAFQRIEAEFSALAKSLKLGKTAAFPAAALKDRGTSVRRAASMPWHHGPALADWLESLDTQPPSGQQFALPIQWVNRAAPDFTGFCGTVASGNIAPGDLVRVTASGQTARVKRILCGADTLTTAQAGDAVTLELDRKIDAARGDVLTRTDAPLDMTDQFEATLFWLHAEPGLIGRGYEIKLACQRADATVTAIKRRIELDSGGEEPARQLESGAVCVCNLALDRPLAFDRHRANPPLGRFILIDRYSQATIAIGTINHNLRRAQNVHRQALNIGRRERERLNGHPGRVLWLTGLSGSGKSTIANALEQALYAQGRRSYILDGDNIRQGLNKDLGFTDADRVENIRRVAEAARLMLDAGLIVITAFISPFRAEREMARQLIGAENFIEVFVDTPLAECERRDPKGLYKKARSGQLPNMTGIGSPYEAPEQADLVVAGGKEKIAEIVRKLLQRLEAD